MPSQSILYCPCCGKAFTVAFPYMIAKRTYCSLSCRSLTHGETIHGRHSPEYGAWQSIKDRCLNPANHYWSWYGGRGIHICEQWRDSFVAFLADVGRRPSPLYSIDRIDNNGDYKPGNVRWATKREQAQNRSNNRMITYEGRTLCLSEWSRVVGIGWATIKHRLTRGWTIEQALTAPPNRKNRRSHVH